MHSKTVRVDNVKIHYLEFGRKNNPSLLLLHGFHGNANSCFGLSYYLSRKFRVLTPDLPGFGKSEKLKNGFSIASVALSMASFIQQLKLKDYYLYGISMGGAIAAEMVPYTEKNLQCLILLSPLFSGKYLKMGRKILFLKAMVKLGKIPIVYHNLAPKLMKNDTFMKYLIKTFSPPPGILDKEIAHRIKNTRTCDCQTYIDGLDEILNYEAKNKEKTYKIKTALLLNPADEAIDPQKTYEGYKTIFPKSAYIKFAIDNHNPIVKPDAASISQKYSHLLEEILQAIGDDLSR